MESDAVKMAIERIKARFHPHYGIDGASDSKQLARDCQTLIVALEQAGEPVAWMYDYRLRFRGDESDWKAGCVSTTKPTNIRPHEPDYRNIEPLYKGEAPLPTLQRLGQEFDAREADAWRYERDADLYLYEKRQPSISALREPGWTETPLYAHPPQSSIAAEPVGLRDIVGKLANADCECDSYHGVTNCLPCQASAALATPSQPDPQSRGQAFDGEGEAIAVPYINPTYAEQHPLLKPIIDKRARAAGNFAPEFSGQRGQDFDRGLLCAFEAVSGELQKMTKAALSSAKRGEEK